MKLVTSRAATQWRGIWTVACGTLAMAAAACGETASDLPIAHDAGVDVARAKVNHDAGRHDVEHGEAGHVTVHDSGNGEAAAEAAHATDAKDAARETATDAPPRDHGDASSVYPAFPPNVPQVQDQGGPTLSAPQIVTITWPGEENIAQLEAFGDDIGVSPYWTATTSEYGVGPATSGPTNHVRLTEQPITSWSDTALATWLVEHVTNYAQYGMPAPTGNTIYTMYLSTATDITVGNQDGCAVAGGYHNSVVVNGADVTYAVILQCNGDVLEYATQSASHELVEASTDPHPFDIAAYTGFDSAHLAWDVFQSFADEVADACEFYYGPNGSDYTQAFSVIEEADAGPDGGDAGLVPDAGAVSFGVQRSWSNVSAAAGHAPCVPAVAGPYYAVTPLDLENITLDLAPIGGGSAAQTLGYDIKKGETKTFAVGFHSDGPTSGPWTISAKESNGMLSSTAPPSDLTITIDNPTGQNGDIAYVTVTVNAVDTTMNGELLTISSRLGTGPRTIVPILISNE